MPVSRWNRAGLTGKTVHWLLDLSYAGRLVRLALEDLTVPSTEHGDLQYVGCLDAFNVPLTLDLFSGSASLLSVRVSGVLPVNVPRLVALGHDLGAARGELSQWIEGTDYETRRIVLRGKVRDPEYGAEDEPVNFALEDSLSDDQGFVPEIAAAATIATWGTAYYFTLADAERGLSYPVVFGYPGKCSLGNVAGSQGVWIWHGTVPDHRLVLAGHRVTAGFVYARADETTSLLRYQVKNKPDLLGRTVAMIDFRVTEPPAPDAYSQSDAVGMYYALGSPSIPASMQPADDVQSDVFVLWSDPINADGGGMAGADGQTVRGAGDVLEAVLNFSTMTLDRTRIGAAKSLLNRFKIDAVIEAGVKPWDWISGNLLPILPVSVVKGPDGVYFVVWRHDATEAEAVAHVDADANPAIEVAESVRYDTSKIVNSLSLKYALSMRSGSYTQTATLGADYDADAPGAGVSYHCALSQRRYRDADAPGSGVFVEEIESPVIYDEDTAYAVLAWRALAHAFAKRTIEILVPENEYAWLERGNVVTISVSWLYLARQVALVEEIEQGDDGLIGLRLLLIEDPTRDSRIV